MKLDQNDKNILFSFTEIPDLFFTEYLSKAKGDYVKIYLYIVFLSKYNKEIKLGDLSKLLSLPFDVIKNAITYLEQEGLILKKHSGYLVTNIQEIELNKLYKPKTALSPEAIEKNEKNQYRAKAIDNINNTFFQGIMSPSWYYDIELWFKKYGFNEEVMIILFNYCFENSALHKNYIQVVAESWHKNNIKTASDLEFYEQKQEKLNKVYKFVAKKLNLNRALTQYEQAYIEKWVVDFSYSIEIIEIALKKTTSKANPTFNYLDQLLSSWNERKLKTPDEIKQFMKDFAEKEKTIKSMQSKEPKKTYNSYEQRKTDFDNLNNIYANINTN